MEPKQDGPLVQPVTGKRVYHKPVVAIYGNLTEVTESVVNPPAHAADAPGHSPGWTPGGRT